MYLIYIKKRHTDIFSILKSIVNSYNNNLTEVKYKKCKSYLLIIILIISIFFSSK